LVLATVFIDRSFPDAINGNTETGKNQEYLQDRIGKIYFTQAFRSYGIGDNRVGDEWKSNLARAHEQLSEQFIYGCLVQLGIVG
jgi:hypothetical protein